MDWWDLFAAAAGTSWACVRAGTVLGASLAVVAARHSVGAGLWLLGVAAWPVTTTLGILLFIVSPAVYMAQYTMSPVFWTMGVIPKLEVGLPGRPRVYIYIYIYTSSLTDVLKHHTLTTLYRHSTYS